MRPFFLIDVELNMPDSEDSESCDITRARFTVARPVGGHNGEFLKEDRRSVARQIVRAIDLIASVSDTDFYDEILDFMAMSKGEDAVSSAFCQATFFDREELSNHIRRLIWRRAPHTVARRMADKFAAMIYKEWMKPPAETKSNEESA